MLDQFLKWAESQTNVSDETMIKVLIFVFGLATRWGFAKVKSWVFRTPGNSPDAAPIKAAVNRPETLMPKGANGADKWNVSERPKNFFPKNVLGSWRRVPDELTMSRPFQPSNGNIDVLKIHLTGKEAGNIYLGGTLQNPDFTKKDVQDIVNDTWMAYYQVKGNEAEMERQQRRLQRGII